MEAALKAIAEPRRRQILELVRERELSAGAIASQFDVTRPAISQHLGVLKEAGLVLDRPSGNRRIYQLDPAGIEALRAYFEQFWTQSLTAFKTAVEQHEKELS